MTKPAPARWDRHSIKAEVHRRGTTLQEISLSAGLHPKACTTALYRRHIAGEHALAKFLGFAPELLWPERYQKPSAWAKRSLQKWRAASQNGDAPADTRVAA